MNCHQKIKPIDRGFNEIIGKQIADAYGLICPDVDVITDIPGNNECLIRSSDLNLTGIFSKPKVCGELTNLYDIWDYLEKYNHNASTLMRDFIKMYAMDMIFGNSDRNETNWGFFRINSDWFLVVLDHEFLFSENNASYVSSICDETIFSLIPEDKEVVHQKQVYDIENFFRTSSDEFRDLFISCFERIDYDRFARILDLAELEMGIKDPNRKQKEEYFIRMYEDISNIIKKYRPVRSLSYGT